VTLSIQGSPDAGSADPSATSETG